MISNAWQEGLAALRRLGRSPWLTLCVVCSLAAGIGMATAVYSLADAVVFRDLPYEDPETLVWVWAARVDRDKAFFSLPDYLDFRDGNSTLRNLEAWTPWAARRVEGTEPRRLEGMRVTRGFFRTLGVKPAQGRFFEPGDQNAIVLGFRLWAQDYGADGAMVGRSIVLNNRAFTVVGVARPEFYFTGSEPELFGIVDPETEALRGQRGMNYLRAVGRLHRGVSAAQARADLAAIEKRLREQYPVDNAKKIAPQVLPLKDEITGPYRAGFQATVAAALLVLALACANLGQVLLIRASARKHDTAMRLALGATPLRVAVAPAFEALSLAVGGALAGLLVAWGAISVLAAWAPAGWPRLHTAGLDARGMVFAAACALCTALLTASAPAWFAYRTGYGAGSRVTRPVGGLLVAIEIALSVGVAANTTLLVWSWRRLPNPGFETAGLTHGRISLPDPKPDGESLQRFVQRMRDSLGERAALAATNAVPLSGINNRTDFVIEGRSPADPAHMPGAQLRWISDGYIESLQAPVRAGRAFTPADTASSVKVALVDDAAAAQFWQGANPVGSRIEVAGQKFEIVGRVGAMKHFSLEEDSLPTLYLPLAQVLPANAPLVASGLSLVARTNAAALRQAVRSVRPDAPLSTVEPVERFAERALTSRRFLLELAAGFAVAALLLAASGVFTVATFEARTRTREIGIRAALGARGWRLAAALAGRPARWILLGVGGGLGLALGLGQAFRSMLYGVTPHEPWVLAMTAALVGLVSLAALAAPAYRAARIDPAAALRSEPL